MTYDEKLEAFRAKFEADSRADLVGRGLTNLNPETYYVCVIKRGSKYDKVDIISGGQQMGRYMVEVRTGNIYGIKAYGQIHKGHQYGTLDTIDDWDFGPYYAKPKENA